MDSIATSVLASLTSAAGYVPPPIITAAPDLKSHHRLALRQEEEEVTMNYCAVVNMQDGNITATCGGDCITSGDYFGCEAYNMPTFVTECLDSTHSSCAQLATQTDAGDWDAATWCCTQSAWPNCATISKDTEDGMLTQFECFYALSGAYSGWDYTSLSSVSAAAEAAASTTLSSAGESTTTDANGAEESGTDGEDEEQDGGSPRASDHTGAIVGGTVGGVALISILGFAFWFVRFKGRKNAAAAGDGSPGVGSIAPTNSAYQSPGVYHPDAAVPPMQQQYTNMAYYPPAQQQPPQGYNPSYQPTYNTGYSPAAINSEPVQLSGSPPPTQPSPLNDTPVDQQHQHHHHH
jgi:hypothetical protein